MKFKKEYWKVNVDTRNLDGFAMAYYNCPKCKSTFPFVLYSEYILPDIKFCSRCGRRLHVKENEK